MSSSAKWGGSGGLMSPWGSAPGRSAGKKSGVAGSGGSQGAKNTPRLGWEW